MEVAVSSYFLSVAVGTAVGIYKKRPLAGFLWPLFLGWIGTLITLLIRSDRLLYSTPDAYVPPTIAAGWYTDPIDANYERWWDGKGWTTTVRPKE